VDAIFEAQEMGGVGAATQHVWKRWRGRSQRPVSHTGARLGPSEIDKGPLRVNTGHGDAKKHKDRTWNRASA
jgi:hypothetical protein